MRIFLTGATGFIGSKIVPELIAAGHQVLGLTRSEAGAQQLRAAGAEVYQGTIEDPDGLRRGAADCDGVIHTAFDHDFDHFVANCEKDHRVILALGEALQGSARPLIVTSGTPMGIAVPGQPASEDHFNADTPIRARRRSWRLRSCCRVGSMCRWCVCRRSTTRESRAW